MEKIKYSEPETEVVVFEAEDIITTSFYGREFESNSNPATTYIDI